MELGDARLAVRIQEGDPAAEKELASRFRARLFAVALARLGDFDAAEDVAQEAMLRGLEALRQGRLQHLEKLGPFLCGTVRHLASSYLRSLRPNPGASLETLEASSDDPEERLGRHELGVLAGRALQCLDAVDQRILLLTVVDGLSSDEVGERLGRSAAAIRQRKRRALRRARREMIELSQGRAARH